MKTIGAILEYVGPLVGEPKVAFEIKLDLPDGTVFKREWKRDGDGKYIAEVPMEVKYRDILRKKEMVCHENYARFLLEVYGPKAKTKANRVLKFVKEVKVKEVDVAPFEVEAKEEEQQKE